MIWVLLCSKRKSRSIFYEHKKFNILIISTQSRFFHYSWNQCLEIYCYAIERKLLKIETLKRNIILGKLLGISLTLIATCNVTIVIHHHTRRQYNVAYIAVDKGYYNNSRHRSIAIIPSGIHSSMAYFPEVTVRQLIFLYFVLLFQ